MADHKGFKHTGQSSALPFNGLMTSTCRRCVIAMERKSLYRIYHYLMVTLNNIMGEWIVSIIIIICVLYVLYYFFNIVRRCNFSRPPRNIRNEVPDFDRRRREAAIERARQNPARRYTRRENRRDRENIRDQELIPLARVTPVQQSKAPFAIQKKKSLFAKNKTLPLPKECSICLDPLKGKPVQCCQCGHCFHEACILKWLKTSTTCPLCRRECF